MLQCGANADIAAKLAVEILRRVGAELDRSVVDQGLGMRQTLIEGQPVDQRL